jgi:hypothetical protein
MTLSPEAVSAQLAARFPELAFRVTVRAWGETRWLCVAGLVGPAADADHDALAAANRDRVIGVFEVTREGEVWLRHSVLLDGATAPDLEAVVEELAAELTRRRSMPSSNT